MVKRNLHFAQVSSSYLFPEVARRVKTFLAAHPSSPLIHLSIGDTSEPLAAPIAEEMEKVSKGLHSREGYQGYGPEQGDKQLRDRIAAIFYPGKIATDEIFISDGAKCDLGRLQTLFGPHASIAIPDPAYPVYADTNLIAGRGALSILPCQAEENFFPSIHQLPNVDILYLCSPNNPTGACLDKKQLHAFVEWARKGKRILVYDAAYASYIQDSSLPRSIYEIEGAEEVAIEVSSFSKLAGFSGVRLGWTVVPHRLRYEDGKSVHADWSRLVTTFFNGASLIAQAGGIAALSEKGLQAIRTQISFYLENAQLLRQALLKKGCCVYGGENAPYLWVAFDKGLSSWDLFQRLLESTHLVTTPGSGFGASGEGCLRFSAFGPREKILEAIGRIDKRWPADL